MPHPFKSIKKCRNYVGIMKERVGFSISYIIPTPKKSKCLNFRKVVYVGVVGAEKSPNFSESKKARI